MARLAGFEPATYGLEVRKSILLSCFIFAYTFLHYPLNAFKIGDLSLSPFILMCNLRVMVTEKEAI